MMHQGVALPISDIRPDGSIESEIFPPELTKEAQNKDVFTPPNHQQMRFMAVNDKRRQNRAAEEGDQGFFITDVHQDPNLPIQEENESDQDQKDQADLQQEEQDDKTQAEEDEDFDFGKAKMDFFKKRAREILMNESEMEYEGNPMPLSNAYKSLKHSVKNPSTVYTKLETKPHYMKMTFSMGRQAPAGGKYVAIQQQMEIVNGNKKIAPVQS